MCYMMLEFLGDKEGRGQDEERQLRGGSQDPDKGKRKGERTIRPRHSSGGEGSDRDQARESGERHRGDSHRHEQLQDGGSSSNKEHDRDSQ